MDMTYCLPKDTLLHGGSYDYKIVKTLGQGSFGITYLAAVQMRGELGSIDATVYVAIKEFFMHEINGREGTSVTSGNKTGVYDKYKGKFIKEAFNLSRLHHKNIIRVVEAFEANNTVYYAMEYVDGGSLDDLIKNSNGISETETLKYAIQIGDALRFMHSKNMLHLDMKPSNIMLHNNKAILIDFGLSKQFDEDGNPESSTTIGGGTAGYAPLEQTNYNGEKKGRLPVTMDVYAFGATLFKMLTGRKPPVASDILNDGFPESDLSKKGVSQNLIDIISKSMEPLRKDRFQSMEEVLKQIELFHGNVIQDHTSSDIDPEKTLLDNKSHSLRPDYKRPDIHPEVVYGGPIPRYFDEPNPNVEQRTAIDNLKAFVLIAVLTGLIIWMIIKWHQKLSYGYSVYYYWLIDCITITMLAGLGIIRPNLFRKIKWLWFGLFIPALLNPLIWDPNWFWEWLVEIVIFIPILIFSSKINDKIMKLIMALFIIFASLMIFGF